MKSSVISGPEQLTEPPELLTVVLIYQRTYQAWTEETDPQGKTVLRQNLRTLHEHLWGLLANPLQDVARGWLNSGVGQDMRANPASYPSRQDALRSLAMNLYLHVIDALPRLQVNPDKNLLACLMIIARRGISKEDQQIYSDSPRSTTRSATGQNPMSGTSGAAMWSMNGRSFERWRDPETPWELADPNSCDLEERVVAAIHKQCCQKEVYAFWQRTLKPEEQQIIEIRWGADPPITFETIAQRLGPGWTAGTVRQRHHRILVRTRQYLQSEGILGDNE